jgi:tripeptide aminopeptidase
VKSVYVFDCSRRPGIYIRECVGLTGFTARFIGRAAHAGVAPEEGINAIALSAAAISKVRLGRVEPDTTVNIGKIRGGEAVNVVPDVVTIEGEVRSFSLERIRQEVETIHETFERSVGQTGSIRFESTQSFGPYVHKADSPAVVHLEEAMRSAGLEPQPIRYMGGSDANVFNAAGIPAVNIGIGAQKPHSVDEFFLLEDLVSSSRIIRELVRAPQP